MQDIHRSLEKVVELNGALAGSVVFVIAAQRNEFCPSEASPISKMLHQLVAIYIRQADIQ
jgi:hypothetical protein